MIWMCQEILNYKNENSNNFEDYFNLKQIDNDAELLLNNFYKRKNLINEDKTPIIEIAKLMGFKMYTSDLKANVSGIIGISSTLSSKFGSDKVIILNKNESDEHILFTIAHEIAHYIYDYNNKYDYYANQYKTDEAQTDEELRANRFAASFLMPKTKFKRFIENNRDLEYDELIMKAKKVFKVPETSIKMRIEELGLML